MPRRGRASGGWARKGNEPRAARRKIAPTASAAQRGPMKAPGPPLLISSRLGGFSREGEGGLAGGRGRARGVQHYMGARPRH